MWLGYAFLGFLASASLVIYLSFIVLVYALNFLGEEHTDEEHAEHHH
jgi:hypothetical protein